MRYFVLFQNGELKYHKDVKKYKGKITLSKSTKVLKTAKNQLELPLNDKTYILLELDRKDQADCPDPEGAQSPTHQIFTNDIDKWIEAIEQVVENL